VDVRAPSQPAYRRLTRADLELIAHRHVRGASDGAIARELDVDRSSVRRARKRPAALELIAAERKRELKRAESQRYRDRKKVLALGAETAPETPPDGPGQPTQPAPPRARAALPVPTAGPERPDFEHTAVHHPPRHPGMVGDASFQGAGSGLGHFGFSRQPGAGSDPAAQVAASHAGRVTLRRPGRVIMVDPAEAAEWRSRGWR
jgi:hypothetical protein